MGSFTLSLDCEGLWGMADNNKVFLDRLITTDSLSFAYDYIYQTLESSGVKCTAAFVTAFAAEREALREVMPDICELAQLSPGWFEFLLPRLKENTDDSLNGLLGVSFWRRLYSAGHEIGWHGTTHMPLSDSTSPAAVKLELEIGRKLFKSLGQDPVSVVFPRNSIGHLEMLMRFGFRSYRARADYGSFSREKSIFRELFFWDRGSRDMPFVNDGLCVCPAGFFLNWPSGIRQLIPVEITVRRWISMLRYAANHNLYVHMWFHPHNLITAPSMRPAFTLIMKEVGDLVKGGYLNNLTMSDIDFFCREGALSE